MAAVTKKVTKKINHDIDEFSNGQYCCFTAYMESEPKWDPETMDWLVYQHEIAPTTGIPHWQGYVELKKSTRLTRLHDLLGIVDKTFDEKGKPLKLGGWCAKKRLGTAMQATVYCEKEDTRDPKFLGPKSFGKRPSEDRKGSGHRTDLEAVGKALQSGVSLRQLAKDHPVAMMKFSRGIERTHALLSEEIQAPDPGIVLRPWQDEVIALIDAGFKKRQVLWIWSYLSAMGKSTFLDYLQFKYGCDAVLPGVFTRADLLFAYKKHKIIAFNLPRQEELHKTHISILETTSDGGVVLSTKYESVMKLLNAVVIVFANIPPPHDLMPERCIEFCIDPEVLAERAAQEARDATLDDYDDILEAESASRV